MAVIRIDEFGGEMPSVSPNALPPEAAQVNSNLLLTTREFRPLSTDQVVASCAAGTKTLYRFARKQDGSFNSNPSTGWITSTQLRSYVKGQIDDERTERTYFTFDDGTQPPRVIDVTGQDRKLGVPRPASLVATVTAVDEFTQEEATNFIYGEFAKAISEAIRANIVTTDPQMRYTGINSGQTRGGPYGTFPTDRLFPAAHSSMPSQWQTMYWLLIARVPNARFDATRLDLAELRAVRDTSYTYIPITAVPYIKYLNRAGFVNALLSLTYPATAGSKAGQAVLTTAQANAIADQVERQLDVNRYAKSKRDELDNKLKDIVKLLFDDNTTSVPTKPVEPSKPTVPEYTYSGGENASYVRSPQWVTYDEQMRQYREQLAQWERNKNNADSALSAFRSRLLTLITEVDALTREIEALCDAEVQRVLNLTFVSDSIDAQGGVSKLVGDTVNRVVETRFYIATFVTDWGEESAPCKPSEMLEVDQNDTVTIQRPSLSTGESYASRHIVKWRLYRSNTGSQSSQFQFVDEIPITTTSYVDTKKPSQLGESCPTITWDEPPYRCDLQFDGWPKPAIGSDPYLRGLVGMPNGIMAGFYDNTVAFCEPYVPYAWPVEYQISTEYPIVGLGVFGQTLFVGTTGNPYFISGADSASMTAHKLDVKQACASRRSIVSVPGGVLYASPDGLCIADPNGVRVVSSNLFTREDWQKLDPSSMVSAWHDGVCYITYTGQGGGCLMFDPVTGKLGRVDFPPATAFFSDTLTDTLYYVDGTSIKAAFAGSQRRTATWRSSRFILPAQQGFAWLKVYGEQTPASPAIVRWYADGSLRYTATIVNTQPVRVPAGRWLEHEIEVESKARIVRVVLAGHTIELQSV